MNKFIYKHTCRVRNEIVVKPVQYLFKKMCESDLQLELQKFDIL